MSDYKPEEVKNIMINSPHGTYLVPLLYVCEARARHYSALDGNWFGSKQHLAELEYAYNDDYVSLDWLINNMDWEDIEHVVIKVNDKKTGTEKEFWTTTDHFKIVTEAEVE